MTTQINNLPFTQGKQFIVVDEEIHIKFAKFLILGWLQEYNNTKPTEIISLLLFSTSKSTYSKYFDLLNIKNVQIYDYYTIKSDENQNNIPNVLDEILKEKKSSIYIIDCLSSLSLVVGINKSSKFVNKLANQVDHLICINRSEFVTSNIPMIETLGNIYVKLSKNVDGLCKNSIDYCVDYVCRKPNGSIKKESEIVTQDFDNYIIKSIKKKSSETKSNAINSGSGVTNIEATFRLEMNNREIQQKKNVDLPYTSASNSTSSKIIYSPDDLDDLDEEDPDDDLCI